MTRLLRPSCRPLWGMALLWIALLLPAAPAPAQKYGGTLRVLLTVNPPSLSLHEETSYYTVVATAPLFNNLVQYDPLAARESMETIRPDLAHTWGWSPDHRVLTFKMQPGVKFHDGKPLTSRDAKNSFDLARGRGEPKLRLAPRQDWFQNIEEIVTNGDIEVSFRLKRPQPSLLAMLANGHGAVYPAHIPSAEWRVKAIGSGPFAMKTYQRDQFIEMERNPAYWIKGRPYLDGIRYNIIRARASRIAAFAAGQVDINTPLETNRPFMLAFKDAAPHLKFVETPLTSFQAVFANPKVKPWDDRRMWRVLNLGLDRNEYVRTVFQGGGVMGGAMLPPPAGPWGLPKERLLAIPGYTTEPGAKDEARKIMTSLGYSAANPLRVKLTVRGDTAFNVDTAVWVAGNLKQVWIEAELRQLETAAFFGALTKFDFALGVHTSGTAADDPDTVLYEHYSCGSPRNYSAYCDPEVQKLFDKQSELFDARERLALVNDIDERMMRDVARVLLGYMVDYNPMQPYVRGYVPHQTARNGMRMEDVWLDK